MAMEKLHIKQAVIVEGKYDKIRLETVVDAVIIPTNGFRIFSDKEMRALIRSLAQTCGIVVLTDSDGAGFKIRGHLSGIVGQGEIINVYIPDIFGKEKRKATPSAEGKLGVEGMDADTLRAAFQQAGVCAVSGPPKEKITKLDLYENGLCGAPDSAVRRRQLFARLGLPERLSANAALPVLCSMMGRGAFLELLERDGV